MTTDLVRVDPAPIIHVAAAANEAAARHLFADYRQRQAVETIRRQNADLALFTTFLFSVGAPPIGDLAIDATAWRGVTWGLVAAFVQWQVQQGYAIGSINVRLASVKAYAKLAYTAEMLSLEVYTQIRTVKGYQQREGMRVDAQRTTTRRSTKKAHAVELTVKQTKHAKNQIAPRERLLMCLLLDHGLRVGEATLLTPDNFDLQHGTIRFYRPKVNKTQTHRLSKDTRAAAAAYLPTVSETARLFPGTRRLHTIVQQLGEALGIPNLSPHDNRHRWATAAVEAGTDLKTLQEAGGWNSLDMPMRYVAASEIANEGVKLR